MKAKDFLELFYIVIIGLTLAAAVAIVIYGIRAKIVNYCAEDSYRCELVNCLNTSFRAEYCVDEYLKNMKK